MWAPAGGLVVRTFSKRYLPSLETVKIQIGHLLLPAPHAVCSSSPGTMRYLAFLGLLGDLL